MSRRAETFFLPCKSAERKNRPDKEPPIRNHLPICHGMTNHNELIPCPVAAVSAASDQLSAFGKTCSILNLLLFFFQFLEKFEHVVKMFLLEWNEWTCPRRHKIEWRVESDFSFLLHKEDVLQESCFASALPSVIRIVRVRFQSEDSFLILSFSHMNGLSSAI
ncbi:hypothetical protein CEXT_196901 [Caerostris extrusa]|uniref:Uncharacterized protein n=1 Tax=Caerostris extrusa TaxID=172846 RepID=A0AAV4Y7R9_CAEEX|nr:hypothetical protein CEXT_196901 [Caerostris extrusa]